ncbi:type VI secretion system-associated protein TagO [Metakosakonia massiliensis]
MNLSRRFPDVKWKVLVAILFQFIAVAVRAAVTDSAMVLESLSACTHELSALDRLDCYDRILKPQQAIANEAGVIESSKDPNWQQAFTQEKERQQKAPIFLMNQYSGEIPRIVLTTPAIGRERIRPVLTFSCIDNITRMQIMLPSPMQSKKGALALITDKGSFKARWFVRSEGYVLEASRGLPGIDEIRHLLSFHADRLTVNAEDPVINGLIFDISTLSEAIKPLRAACRW